MWVRETMPVGWGDTYIHVTANPGHHLHETTTANDVTARKVIISGTRGHRHVKVPAWNDIDPKGEPVACLWRRGWRRWFRDRPRAHPAVPGARAPARSG